MTERHYEKGYSLLEFLVVVPLLVGVVIAALDLSRYLQARSAIRQASQVGIRCLFTTEGKCNVSSVRPSYSWERQLIREEYEEQLYDYEALVPTITGPEYHYSELTAQVLDSLQFTVNAIIEPILVGGTNNFHYQYWEQISPLPRFVPQPAIQAEGNRSWRTPDRSRRWGENGAGISRIGGEGISSLESGVGQTHIILGVFSMPQFPVDDILPCLSNCTGASCQPCTLSNKLPLVLHVLGDHVGGTGTVQLEMAITPDIASKPSSDSSLWQSLGGQVLRSKGNDTNDSDASFIPRGAVEWDVRSNVQIPAESKEEYNKRLQLAPHERLWIKVSLGTGSVNLSWKLRGVNVYYPEFKFNSDETSPCVWNDSGTKCAPSVDDRFKKYQAELEKGIIDYPDPPSKECPQGDLSTEEGGCGFVEKVLEPIGCRENKGLAEEEQSRVDRLISVCNPVLPIPDNYISMVAHSKWVGVPVNITVRKQHCLDSDDSGVLAAAGGYRQIINYIRSEARYTVSQKVANCQGVTSLPEPYQCAEFEIIKKPLESTGDSGILSGFHPGFCDWESEVKEAAMAQGAVCIDPKAYQAGTRKTLVRPSQCGNSKLLGVSARAVAGWEFAGVSDSKANPPSLCRSLEQRCAVHEDSNQRTQCIMKGERYSCRVNKVENSEGRVSIEVAEQLAIAHLQHVVPWLYHEQKRLKGLHADLVNVGEKVTHCNGENCPKVTAKAGDTQGSQVAMLIEAKVPLVSLSVLEVMGLRRHGAGGKAWIRYEHSREKERAAS